MNRFRTSLPAQLALAESSLLVALTVVALWIVSSSVQYADLERTQWPTFIVRFAPELISLTSVFVVGVVAGAYVVLRIVNRGHLPFWVLTALLMAVHIPDVWAHNRIDWHGFFGRYLYFSEPLPIMTSAIVFLLTVAGLVALRRIIQLRAQAWEMESRGVDPVERDGVIRNEAISIAAVIVISLVVTSVMVLIGTAVGRVDALSGLVPWTVVTVGVVATLLLAGFLLFLYRGLSGGASSTPADTDDGLLDEDESDPESL